jgi:hypothetical protein
LLKILKSPKVGKSESPKEKKKKQVYCFSFES